MIEVIELGSAPCEEECVQVSSKEDYAEKMRVEVTRYIGLLAHRFPEHEKKGIVLRNKWFPHDFGGYREAVAVFNGDDMEAAEYAYWMEENTPLKWSDEEILLMPKTESAVA